LWRSARTVGSQPTLASCTGKNKRGEPCRATVVGPDGLCSAHSGRQDMRELGRAGGKTRRAGVAEKLKATESPRR
jgi:hypothetical protein